MRVRTYIYTDGNGNQSTWLRGSEVAVWATMTGKTSYLSATSWQLVSKFNANTNGSRYKGDANGTIVPQTDSRFQSNKPFEGAPTTETRGQWWALRFDASGNVTSAVNLGTQVPNTTAVTQSCLTSFAT